MILLKQIAAGIGSIAIAIAGLFGAAAPHSFGGTTANPSVAAVFETSLAAPMGSSDVAFTLASVQVDSAGDTLAAGVTYPFTVDQGTNVQEFVTATCISTACTVVQRGLSPLTGTTTVTALKFAHRRGADVKITDWPTLGIVNNQLNGIETLPRPLVYSSAVGTSTISVNGKNLVDVDLATYLLTIGGTNFWTLSTNNITNSNTGSVSVAKNFNILDSGGATSTFMGPISFLGGAGGQPYVLIATGTPPYGYIPGDLIDAGNSTNGFAAINTFNSTSGTCATSNFVMNGNIPGLGSDYFDLGFTNTGWTGVGAGCLSSGLTFVKPESSYLFNPTGEMDFVLGTTTPSYGFNWYENGTNLMSLLPAGLTVATSTVTGSATFSGAVAGLRTTYASTTPNLTKNNGYATTTAFFSVPAGALSASSTIDIYGDFSCAQTNTTITACHVFIGNDLGTKYADMPVIPATNNNMTVDCSFHAQILFNNSLSAQITLTQTNGGTFIGAQLSSCATNLIKSTSLNFANAQKIGFIVQGIDANATVTLNNYSIVQTR